MNTFEVKIEKLSQLFKFNYKLTQDPYYCNDLILEVVKNFAVGDQKTVEKRQKHTRETLTDVRVPVEYWWNYLKLAVVTFCPDLDFGWLAPEYYTIETSSKTTIYNETTYYNVCPAEDVGWRKELGRSYLRIPHPKPFEFLQRKPLTNDERERNLHDSYDRNYLGRPVDEFPRPHTRPSRYGDDWDERGRM